MKTFQKNSRTHEYTMASANSAALPQAGFQGDEKAGSVSGPAASGAAGSSSSSSGLPGVQHPAGAQQTQQQGTIAGAGQTQTFQPRTCVAYFNACADCIGDIPIEPFLHGCEEIKKLVCKYTGNRPASFAAVNRNTAACSKCVYASLVTVGCAL